MRRLFSKLAVLLIVIGCGFFIMKVAQHQFLSMSNHIVEQNQERQEQQKQAAAQLKTETHSMEQQKAELKVQMESFDSDRRRAFDDAYITPEGCGAPQTERQFTKCINHKMRAKRTFFTSYGPPPNGLHNSVKGIQYGEPD